MSNEPNEAEKKLARDIVLGCCPYYTTIDIARVLAAHRADESELAILKETFALGFCDCDAWAQYATTDPERHDPFCKFAQWMRTAIRRIAAHAAAKS